MDPIYIQTLTIPVPIRLQYVLQTMIYLTETKATQGLLLLKKINLYSFIEYKLYEGKTFFWPRYLIYIIYNHVIQIYTVALAKYSVSGLKFGPSPSASDLLYLNTQTLFRRVCRRWSVATWQMPCVQLSSFHGVPSQPV